MKPNVSKTRSRVSRLRDRRESRRRNREAWPGPEMLLGLLLGVATLAFLHLGQAPQNLPAPGQEARVAVISSVEFSCVDVERTDWMRLQAAEAAPPLFTLRSGTLHAATHALDKLFDRLLMLRRAMEEGQTPETLQRSLADALDLLNVPLTPPAFLSLVPTEREEFILATLKQALNETWAEGILSAADRESAFHGIVSKGRLSILGPDKQPLPPVRVEDLRLPEEALAEVVERVRNALPDADPDILTRLFQPWIEPNLVHDPGRTQQQRESLRRGIEPVLLRVPAGATLVEAGERVTPSILEKLRAHTRRLQELRSPLDRLFQIIGDAGLLVAALIFCGGLLHVFQPGLLRRKSTLLLTLSLTLLTLGAARGMVILTDRTGWLPPGLTAHLLPLGLAPLVVAILAGGPLAAAIGCWITLATALFMGGHFYIVLAGLLVTLVSIDAAQGAHRRSRVFRAGLWIGLAHILCAIAHGIIVQLPALTILAQSAAALANGLLCAFLALLLIPLFELSFGFTSDITLLELSDMGSPLLRRLAMEAPGTYHHSLMVAHLAEAGARAIGANGLLVRVGAYYHDIGKLTKPEFFTENAQQRDNPHDDLAPSMSTLVITSHVKEGATLGRRHKLPQVILDAIEQHHGSGLVSFFYHRARQQQSAGSNSASNDASVKETDFRYSGPKPVSREMAILSLADAVEAASRSMDKPTPGRIENLVADLVNTKLLDGQLDQSDLTLAELGVLRRTFMITLTNMLHGRIPYPKDEDRSKQPAAPAAEPSGAEPPAS